MPYVRGHYRRRSRSSASGNLALAVLALVGFAAYGAVLLVAMAVDFATKNVALVAAVGAIVLAVPGAVFVRRALRERRVRRYLVAAGAVIEAEMPDADQLDSLATLRNAAQPLPEEAVAAAGELYRDLVAKVVEDRKVTPRELGRLATAERALDLSQDAIELTRIEGFLEVFNSLVGDGRLTEAEEITLKALQATLSIPAGCLGEQLRFADQLRRAREAETQDLRPIESQIKLKRGEECYFSAPVTERKRVNAKSFVRDGVRHVEQKLEVERTGTIYLTSERLLIVADGTTSIAKDAILDIAVDGAKSLMLVTKDGRKAPYFFETGEPFLAAAILNRVRQRSAA